jgi:hypothetical protein
MVLCLVTSTINIPPCFLCIDRLYFCWYINSVLIHFLSHCLQFLLLSTVCSEYWWFFWGTWTNFSRAYTLDHDTGDEQIQPVGQI